MKRLSALILAYFVTISLCYAQPSADFSFSYSNNGCLPDSVSFTNLSVGAVSYEWDFGDFSPMSFDSDPVHEYFWNNSFLVKLTAYDGLGGSDVATAIVTINQVSWAGYGSTPSIFNDVCFGDMIEFENFSWPVPDSTRWIFGDGDTSDTFDATHQYAAPGSYSFEMIAYSRCGLDTVVQLVNVTGTAQPTFSFWVNPNPVCPGEDVIFSSWTFSNVTLWEWDFNMDDVTESNDQNPVWSFSATVDSVRLIGYNNCGSDTMYNQVIVDTSISPVVSAWADNDSICPDDTINFTGWGNRLVSFFWDFKDGQFSTLQNPSHSYASPGTYNVQFIGVNACGNSDSYTVTVVVDIAATPDAMFSFDPWEPCPGSVVSFNNFSSTTEYGVYWDFDDGYSSTEVNPTHSFASSGTYNVELKVYNSCGNSDIMLNPVNVTTSGVPWANWSSMPGSWQPICQGTTVTFTNWSSDTTNCFWDFGDGTTSTSVNPSHTYDSLGIYPVILSVTNSCGNSASSWIQSFNVKNNIPPTAQFWANPSNACVGEQIEFFNWSSETNNNFWDFGDGTTSTEVLPFYSYSVSGIYPVMLAITNLCGADTAWENVTVLPTPNANFSATMECLGTPTSFTNLSTGVINGWSWDFGDGGVSMLQNPVYAYPTSDNFDAKLTVTGGTCSDDTTIMVIVNGVVADAGTDVTICPGGIASLSASGGVNYSWDNGASLSDPNSANPDANPLVSTTYTVTVSDSFGCTSTDTVTVNIGALIANAGPDQNICSGESAQLSASGGSIFAWNNPAGLNNPNISNPIATVLSTITYTVTISDGSGCSETDSMVVTVNTVIANAGPDIAICQGSITQLSASGGLNYHWIPASVSNPNISNPIASPSSTTLYTVEVTDVFGCMDTDNMTVTVTSIPSPYLLAKTNATCLGECDGQATIAVSGGAFPFSYLWNDPMSQTTETAISLCSGTYLVTVTDTTGCTGLGGATITDPVIISFTSTNSVSCGGVCDGDATVIPSGGVPPISFVWGDALNQTTQVATSLCAGDYFVTVTDVNGCSHLDSATVVEPPAITLVVSGSDVICNGDCNGDASVIAIGGNPPYSIQWDDPGFQTTTIISGLCTGLYHVTVTDFMLCEEMDSVLIGEPDLMTDSILSADVSCFGVNDGSADLSVYGGTAPYAYSWSSGDGSEDVSGLITGTYWVTIDDANGCQKTDSIVVNEPAELTNTILGINVSCIGSNDGATDLTIAGGVVPYSINWSNSDTIQDISGLSAGLYNVTITDVNGCQITDNVTIGGPVPINITTIANNANCGNNDGDATANASGGATPYTYLWSDNQTDQTAINLFAGVYSVTVTDSVGCTSDDIALVNNISTLVASVTGITDASCYSLCDGQAIVTAGGGTPPYTYLWSDPDSQTTSAVSGLCTGMVTVTVTDSANCQMIDNRFVGEPAPLNLVFITTDVTCFGDLDGAIDLTVAGGTFPYLFDWSSGSTNEDISGCSSGVFNVMVTDSNACSIVDSVIVGEPPLLTALVTGFGVSCFGDSDGSATANSSGGNSPYTYLWDIVETSTQVFNGVGGVVNESSVNDFSINVTGLGNLDGVAFSFGEICLSINHDRNADLDIYLISPDATIIELASDLGGTVPDGYLATCFNQSAPTGIAVETAPFNGTFQPELDNLNTFNNNQPANGIWTLRVIEDANPGGPGTVNGWSLGFLINDGATTQSVSSLVPGTYNVTITDGKGCQAADSVTIGEPTVLSSSISGSDASCFGMANGAADLTVTGGTAPYSYFWGGGDTIEDISALLAGFYNLTVTDGNGCTIEDTVSVGEPPVLLLSDSITDATCDSSNGQIAISVVGGTPPYMYWWSSGSSTDTADSLSAGIYNVNVIDSLGCSVTSSYSLNNVGGPTLVISAVDVSCNSNCDGSIDVTASGGILPYTYSWSMGGSASFQDSICAGDYYVTVTDSSGCITAIMATVTEPDLVSLTLASTDDFGSSDGTASVAVGGGIPPYTYLWDDTLSQVSPLATNLTGGLYTVVVIDSVGCTKSDTITVHLAVTIVESGRTFEIRVFPNPAIDILNVQVKGNTGDLEVFILNVHGQVICGKKDIEISGEVTTFQMNNYPKGIYFIKVVSNNVVRLHKILVQ